MKRFIIIIFMAMLFIVNAKVLDPSAPYGSRKNPVPSGEWIQFSTGEQEVALLVAGVIAGEKANEMLYDANQFGTRPGENQEYFLIGIQAACLKDLTGNDVPFSISRFSWRLADEKYTILNKFDIILIGDAELNATMYEGGDTLGMLVYIVDKGKEYYAVYDDKWFDLTSIVR